MVALARRLLHASSDCNDVNCDCNDDVDCDVNDVNCDDEIIDGTGPGIMSVVALYSAPCRHIQ